MDICGQSPLSDDANQSVAASDLISAGTYLIGVYVLVFALTGAVSLELSSLAAPALNSGVPDSSPSGDGQNIAFRINYALRIIAGIALMRFGRRAQRTQHVGESE